MAAWEAAYAGSSTITVPADLQAALDATPAAAEAFVSLNRQNRYAILYRLGTVKRDSTRARKIDQYVAMLARGETIYPQKTPGASWYRPSAGPLRRAACRGLLGDLCR